MNVLATELYTYKWSRYSILRSVYFATVKNKELIVCQLHVNKAVFKIKNKIKNLKVFT